MTRIDMPEDFPEHARASMTELASIYHISKTTARNWRKELGISVPRGAPSGNRNANRPKSKEKPVHGKDGPDTVQICLNCTAKKCRGHCAKVH